MPADVQFDRLNDRRDCSRDGFILIQLVFIRQDQESVRLKYQRDLEKLK